MFSNIFSIPSGSSGRRQEIPFISPFLSSPFRIYFSSYSYLIPRLTLLLSSSPLLLPPLFLAYTHCPLRAYTAGAIYVLRPAEERPTTVNLNTDATAQ